MVDITTLQAWGYIFGYFSVGVAALSFTFNMRVSQRNMRHTLETRKLQFINDITRNLINDEGMKKWLTLMYMEWSDYDDFEKKYGSDVNLDNCAKRLSMWYNYDNLGAMLRSNFVDAETMYSSTLFGAYEMWMKYEDVLVEQRRRYNSATEYANWEYLAKEMLRVRLARDPSYKLTALPYVPDKVTSP